MPGLAIGACTSDPFLTWNLLTVDLLSTNCTLKSTLAFWNKPSFKLTIMNCEFWKYLRIINPMF